MTRKFFIATAVAMAATSGVAQAQAVFAEFSVGAGFPQNVETVQYDVITPVGFTTPGGVVVNPGDRLVGSLSGEYEAGISGGLEIGLRGVGDKRLSLTLSYDYLQANLSEITATGTINGAPASETNSLAALGLSGSDFNNEAHLVLGNIRYDFLGPKEPIQPFLEVGGGGAFIEDSPTSAALGATAGFRVPLGLGFYAGARYRYVKVFGYEDQIGIDYNNLDAHLISFMLGAHM
jgi:hypothetical protein